MILLYGEQETMIFEFEATVTKTQTHIYTEFMESVLSLIP